MLLSIIFLSTKTYKTPQMPHFSQQFDSETALLKYAPINWYSDDWRLILTKKWILIKLLLFRKERTATRRPEAGHLSTDIIEHLRNIEKSREKSLKRSKKGHGVKRRATARSNCFSLAGLLICLAPNKSKRRKGGSEDFSTEL